MSESTPVDDHPAGNDTTHSLALKPGWALGCYQDLADDLPQPVFEVDAEGRVVFANRAAYEVFGYTPADLERGVIVIDRVAPHDRQRAMANIARLLRGERLQGQQYDLLRSDGTVFPALLYSRRIIRNGGVVGLRGIIVDITERRRAEEALERAREELEERVRERTAALGAANERLRRELHERQRAEEALRVSEARYRAIFDAANDGIAVVELPSVRFLDVNRRYVEIYGYTLAELQHLSVGDLSAGTPPFTEQDASRWMQAAMAGKPQVFEWLAKRKDGSLLWTEVSLRLADMAGKADLVAVIRDIAERKRSEQDRERLLAELSRLAQQAQQHVAELQAVLDNMLDAVLVADRQALVTMINEAGVRLLGLGGPEEGRRSLADLQRLIRARRPDGRALSLEESPLRRALAGETVADWDQVIYNAIRQRDIFLRVNAAPIRDGAGEVVGAVAVGRDMSEVIEANRLKDEFVRVAAHELKTPVTIMKGYAQTLLRSGAEEPQPQRRMLQAIDRGADRIARIIEDLLDISRLQAGPLELAEERIDLPALVAEAVERTALRSPRHNLRVVRSEPAAVQGDRERLSEVLESLLDNAVKYSPEGGDVDVALAVQDGEAVISVRDWGVGIPAERQTRIFERFYRAHAGTPYDFGGMGVGLYIAREVVQRHGGRMWFESREGQGSTFYVALPLLATS
ncbi:MAG: PAS domain-containing sensor histidine kinase [Anaerolineae bacterium]